MSLHAKFGSEFSIVQLVYCSHAAMAGDKTSFERDLFDILSHSHTYNPLVSVQDHVEFWGSVMIPLRSPRFVGAADVDC